MQLEIKLSNESVRHLFDATRIAVEFHKKFPSRVGRHNGVGYRTSCGCLDTTHILSLYVYRTAVGTIVVRES